VLDDPFIIFLSQVDTMNRHFAMQLLGSAAAALLGALPLATQAQNCTAPNADSDYILGTAQGMGDAAMHWNSGLVWKRCVEGMTYSGGACTGAPTANTWNAWADADRLLPQAFAGQASWGISLPMDHRLLHSGGWRMAYYQELLHLRESCGYGPSVNRSVFPDTPGSWVWSGSPHADNTANARLVSFASNGFGYTDRTDTWHARLVRGGLPFEPLVSPPAFTVPALTTATFTFPLKSSITLGPPNQVWGGARVSGTNAPEFQINGAGPWLTEAIVKSGDELTIRMIALPPGGQTATATLTLRSGQTTGTSANGANGGTESTSAQETTATYTVITGGAPPPPSTPLLDPASDSGTPGDGITSAQQPTLTGTAQPGDTVALFDGATPLGTTTADAAGQWRFTPAAPLATGPGHAISATASNGTGTSGASGALTLNIALFDGPVGNTQVLLTSNQQGCALDAPPAFAPADLTAAPAGATAPLGALGFSASGCAGGTLAVRATYPPGNLTGLTPYKQGPASTGAPASWFPLGTVTGDAVSWSVPDNGAGDNDSASGAIRDPHAMLLLGTTPVPTLGHWALVLLGLLAAGLGIRRLRSHSLP
jgi:hypothetical protein